jgi:hypothetical protein
MGRLSGYRYRDVVAGIGSALHRRRLFLMTSLQLIATELADLNRAGGAGVSGAKP